MDPAELEAETLDYDHRVLEFEQRTKQRSMA